MHISMRRLVALFPLELATRLMRKQPEESVVRIDGVTDVDRRAGILQLNACMMFAAMLKSAIVDRGKAVRLTEQLMPVDAPIEFKSLRHNSTWKNYIDQCYYEFFSEQTGDIEQVQAAFQQSIRTTIATHGMLKLPLDLCLMRDDDGYYVTNQSPEMLRRLTSDLSELKRGPQRWAPLFLFQVFVLVLNVLISWLTITHPIASVPTASRYPLMTSEVNMDNPKDRLEALFPMDLVRTLMIIDLYRRTVGEPEDRLEKSSASGDAEALSVEKVSQRLLESTRRFEASIGHDALHRIEQSAKQLRLLACLMFATMLKNATSNQEQPAKLTDKLIPVDPPSSFADMRHFQTWPLFFHSHYNLFFEGRIVDALQVQAAFQQAVREAIATHGTLRLLFGVHIANRDGYIAFE